MTEIDCAHLKFDAINMFESFRKCTFLFRMN